MIDKEIMKRSKLIFAVFKVPLDYLAIVSAFLLAYYTRTQTSFDYMWEFDRFLKFTLSIAPIWIIIFALQGLYDPKHQDKASGEVAKIIIGNFAGTMTAMSWIFISRTDFFSRLVVFYALAYSIILVSLCRILLASLQHWLYHFDIGVIRLAVIGSKGIAKVFINNLKKDKTSGYKVTKILDDLTVDKLPQIIPKDIDEVLLADSGLLETQTSRVLEYCQERGIGFKIIPNLFKIQTNRVNVSVIANIPIIEYRRTPLEGWGAVTKRIFDIIGSLVFMILLFPVFLLAVLGIKITSPDGPILFRQRRIGLGKEFTFLKFRSMVPNAQLQHKKLIKRYGNMFKLKDDPRVTRFGKFLRRTSIDELPQLWNVLKGEMSLVGPRPPMPEEVKLYNAWHRKRLGIKPGITGLWQVSGRSEVDFDECVRLDVFYIENWSLWMDLMIILKTIGVVLKGRGAY
jgi:exopolysaccharide biosynthesis polyprenyl glycosylphosphotransferase